MNDLSIITLNYDRFAVVVLRGWSPASRVVHTAGVPEAIKISAAARIAG
jgi:hypothetical protein